MSNTIGIDVGGTKVLGGVVTDSGEILTTLRKETPTEGGRALIECIASVARKLMADNNVAAVGISAAGFISSDRRTVLATPNISNWNGIDINEQLAELLGVPIVVENDANAAIWGEFKFGAGKGLHNLIALTLGTGVGGGIIADGQLYRGAFGIGAELGHIRLIPNGQQCGCGARGCLEQYASGTALLRIAREAVTNNPEDSQALLSLGDGTLDGLKGEHLTTAAFDGDALATSIFNTLGDYLGAGVASLCAVLNPSHVIIGGGVIEAGEIILKPTRDSLIANMPFCGKHPLPEIVAAQLGNNAGLIGIADLARI
jgi:glucokinase